LDGKTIQKQNLQLGDQTVVVNTEGWAKGIYLAEIEVEGKIEFSEKLVLN
jgi:hypothetical protein